LFLRGLSIAQRMLASHIVIIMISFLSLGAYWSYQELEAFHDESRRIRQDFIKQKNQEIKAEVAKALGYIQFAKHQLDVRLRAELRTKVEFALKMASNLYLKNQGAQPLDKIKDQVRDILRDQRFWQGRGYFFAIDMQGVTQLFPIRPKLEGMSLLNQADTEGKFFNQEFIRLAREKGQGYASYTWHKPGQIGRGHKKLSFVMHFKPFDWVIGAGEYLDDWVKMSQEDVLSGLSSVMFGEEGYLFAGDYQGVSLLGPARGKSMWEVTDAHGKKIVQALVAAARSGGGFVEYVMPALEGKRSARKVSYACGIPDWGWYVGAGYYLDEIETQIALKQAELRKAIRDRLVSIILFVILAFIIAVMLSRLFSGRLAKEIAVFKGFFQKAASQDAQIPLDHLRSAEFKKLAQAANSMVDKRRQMQEEKREMENKLIQAQKMEAVGTLAGGVAHDFNNILAIISGYTELALDNSVQGMTSQYELDQVLQAALRGKTLVKQILAFSRRTEPELKPMELNKVAEFVISIWLRTAPKSISIKTSLDPDLWNIMGDPGQMEQVLLNLGSNAQDAMPKGGVLGISTSNLDLPNGQDGGLSGVEPGKYVMLRVTDTGEGMSPEIERHMFEPFFTTKDVGKGTGLGLSTVFGIVGAHGGQVVCKTGQDSGSEFLVYLPADPDLVVIPQAEVAKPELKPGNGTILLVDDEEPLREVGVRLFSSSGYDVLAAGSGEEALEVLRQDPAKISLVVLDLGMPGMGGHECMRAMLEIKPGIKVVVASGYSQDSMVRYTLELGAEAFVSKPYSASELLETVQNVLDP
jgi:signal transduction histidine kinase